MRALLVTALVAVAMPLAAQAAPDLARERADFTSWLATDPLSPYAAIAVQPVGPGITLGPDSTDVVLGGIDKVRIVEERAGLVLISGNARRVLPRGRPVALGSYRLVADGEAGRRVVVVYGAVKDAHPPAYYPPGNSRVTVELAAPSRKGAFRTLGLDGVETMAEEVGIASVPLGNTVTQLRVYRMGATDDDEAELMIFFRDATSNKGTYPAGRFVALDPAGGRKYTIDFNRARNPFCAYNTVFPCPAPWPGNTLPLAIEAGERYGK
ncbi:MAG TPA: DUF1684 domain-containing protein [Gemmatimonadales bacterium]|nr:DUF1684 domain-containing protein [Gemmatimonadales bacterium]